MRTTLKAFILAVALLGTTAIAHDTDGACAQEGARMTIVGSFNFGSQELLEFQQRELSGGIRLPPGGMCTPSSCGIVDDHWAVATRRAFQYCEQIAPGSIAQVSSPATYNDALLHHSAYSFGPNTPNLQGLCVRCQVLSSTPIKLTTATNGLRP
ncbi:hypothetical protein [Lysobacter sp. CA196]|uniref:hypothetical protein n=1 Tax=Lysobacter sp. CA196 TaxID=3455606 RepID=UPI003F8CF313